MLDTIQFAEAVLVLIIYTLFVEEKYIFTVLSKGYNGGFEDVHSMQIHVVPST